VANLGEQHEPGGRPGGAIARRPGLIAAALGACVVGVPVVVGFIATGLGGLLAIIVAISLVPSGADMVAARRRGETSRWRPLGRLFADAPDGPTRRPPCNGLRWRIWSSRCSF